MKRAWVLVVAVVVALVVIGLGITAAQLGDMEGVRRVDIAPGIVGIATGKSYAYVVDSSSGVVLVDTGSDRQLHAVAAELAQRGKALSDVKAVLLTSAHPLTLSGLDALPSIPVYVGGDDEDAMRSPRLVKAPLARLLARFGSHKKHDNPAILVAAGARLVVDGLSVEAVATPGLTPGARVYLIGDVAFVGASFVSRDGRLEPQSVWLAGDRDAIIASMQRLAAHPFTWLAGATLEPTAHGRALYDAWRDSLSDALRVSVP